MATSKKQVAHHPEHYQLQTLGTESFGPLTLGAGVVNTTQSALLFIPSPCKVVKVTITYLACDTVAGTDLVNIVASPVGGAYTQGNVPGNDNSYAPTFQPGPLTAISAYPAPAPSFGLGYPTNVALINQSMFLADIPITNAANAAQVNYNASANPPQAVPSVAVPNPAFGLPGFGWVLASTTGGAGVFLPANYDAVYSGIFSLRVTTTAGTGSITGLTVSLLYEPMYIRPSVPGPDVLPYPGIDF